MTQPIDEIYVDLHARGEEQAARDVERAAKNMERYLDNATREIQRDIARAGRAIGRDITAGAKVAERAVDDLADDATRDLRRIEREARDAGESIGRSFSGGAGFGGIIDSLSQMGAQLRNISALAPPPILLALAAAVPAILALGGALADLSGLLLLLPAGIGGLIASVAALQLAFSGVGDAVEALASGDLEKINEAMKKLAPSAQAFAREINALREPLRQLKKDVQEAFFAPLRGDITKLVNAALPTLRTGLAQVAGAFGNLADQLIELVGSNDVLEAIGDVFAGTARIINNLAPQITDLLGTLFGVAERGMPFLERAFGALGRGIESLDKFLEGALQSGDFEAFLEDAFQIMSDLGNLAKSVFNLLGALFGDMGDEGSTFIQTLADMTQALADFFNSAEGQAILQRLVDVLPLLLDSLVVGVTVLGALAVAVEATYRTLELLGGWVLDAGKAVGEFFTNLDDWASNAGDAIGNAAGAAGEFFTGILDTVGGAIEAVGAFFTELFNWITDFDNITYAISFVLGSIIDMAKNMVTLVIEAFAGLVAASYAQFLQVRNFIIEHVTAAVVSTINFFTSLPERITAALQALQDLVTGFFKRSRDNAVNQTKSLYDTVITFFRNLGPRALEFIHTLPERLTAIFQSLVSRARSIGGNIINGIVDGIRNGIGAAIDFARRAARNILDGMMDALDIGSPSKLAASEVGKPLMQGVGVGARDAVPDVRSEINRATVGVLPGVTTSSSGGGDGGSGGSITFDAGAVQVVFQGAVPTEAEAFRTGQAVGAGIAQVIARRDVRTAVRVA